MSRRSCKGCQHSCHRHWLIGGDLPVYTPFPRKHALPGKLFAFYVSSPSLDLYCEFGFRIPLSVAIWRTIGRTWFYGDKSHRMNVHSICYRTLEALSSLCGLHLEQNSKLKSAKTTISVLIPPTRYPHRRTTISVRIFSDQSRTRYRPKPL